MTVYIVKIDTAEPGEPPYWIIDKVFASENAAREYAATDVKSEIEAHDVILQFAHLPRIESHVF